MDFLQTIFDYVLGLGSHIFLPLVMVFVGLLVKMKFKDAFSAALTLGVAFIGMGTIVDFMFGFLSPAAEALVENSGIQLTAIDVGWAPLAAIAWAWPYAFLLFPIQIAINLFMIAINKTSTLNVDLWNVWNKILTAVMVAAISGSVPLALVIGAIQVVFELWNADLTQKQIYKTTGIPGVSCPHSMAMFAVVLNPFNKLMEKIPGLKADIDAEVLKDKIGIFAENHVMGFIIGVIIAVVAGYDVQGALTVGVSTGTALTLFPMVAKLFMVALSPISDAAGEFMKKRFPGREFFIGLDWPFLAGSPELWVAAIILVPITLLYAVILPGNNVLPLGGIINICLVVPLLIITGGNLVRMIVMGAMSVPIFLYVGTLLAPIITDLAITTGTYNVPAGQMISWSGMEMPVFRFVFSRAANIINGDFLGIAMLVGWLALWFLYVKEFKARNKAFDEEEA